MFVVLFSRSLVGNLPGRRSNFLPVQHLPIPLSLKNGAEFKTIFPICVSMELFFQFAFTDASVTLHLSCTTKCVLELWLHCCLLIATGNSVNHCLLATCSFAIGTSHLSVPLILLLEFSDKDTFPPQVCSDFFSSFLTGQHSMFILSHCRFFGHAVLATQLMTTFTNEHSGEDITFFPPIWILPLQDTVAIFFLLMNWPDEHLCHRHVFQLTPPAKSVTETSCSCIPHENFHKMAKTSSCIHNLPIVPANSLPQMAWEEHSCPYTSNDNAICS